MSRDNNLRKAIKIQIDYLCRFKSAVTEIHIANALEAILNKAQLLDAQDRRQEEDQRKL